MSCFFQVDYKLVLRIEVKLQIESVLFDLFTTIRRETYRKKAIKKDISVDKIIHLSHFCVFSCNKMQRNKYTYIYYK